MNKQHLNLLSYEDFCKAIGDYFAYCYSATVTIKKLNRLYPRELVVERDGFENLRFTGLEELYANYRRGESFADIVRNLSQSYEEACKEKTEKNRGINVIDISNFDEIKSSIIFDFVNKQKNKHLLRHIPHVVFNEDIAIVFKYCYKNDLNSMLFIKDSMLVDWQEKDESYEMFLNKLYRVAYENTKHIVATKVDSMENFMIREYKQYLADKGVHISDIKIKKDMEEKLSKVSGKMFVLTNKLHQLNATGVLYTDLMDEIARKMNTDSFYFVFNSKHEVDAFPINIYSDSKSGMTLNDLKLMNESEADKGYYLSGKIYYYDSVTKRVSVAL